MQVRIAKLLAGGSASEPFVPKSATYALFAARTSLSTDISPQFCVEVCKPPVICRGKITNKE
jgi:hypothetical protein